MRNLVLLTFVGLVAAPLGAYAQDLPPGPGADVTTRVCTACHGASEMMSERHDADGWGSVVSQMVGQGANATDAEQEQIINYLAATFPKPGAAPADAAAPAAPADAAAFPPAPGATPVPPATPAP